MFEMTLAQWELLLLGSKMPLSGRPNGVVQAPFFSWVEVLTPTQGARGVLRVTFSFEGDAEGGERRESDLSLSFFRAPKKMRVQPGQAGTLFRAPSRNDVGGTAPGRRAAP